MTLDTYGLLLFLAGLGAGVGITLLVQIAPAFPAVARSVHRYGRQHRRQYAGFVLLLILVETAAALILFTA